MPILCVKAREHSIELDKVNTWQQQEEHRASERYVVVDDDDWTIWIGSSVDVSALSWVSERRAEDRWDDAERVFNTRVRAKFKNQFSNYSTAVGAITKLDDNIVKGKMEIYKYIEF